MSPPQRHPSRSTRQRTAANKRTYDCDVAVIGAGPAGLAAARLAARAGKRVVLFEAQRLGGTSLNSGSVPSKALIRSATLFAAVRETSRLWAQRPQVPSPTEPPRHPAAAYRAAHRKVQLLGTTLAPRNRDALLQRGVRQDRRTLIAEGLHVRFNKAIVATGAISAPPQFPGLRRRYVTSETIFGLTQLPGRLAVVGGGPLGCELAQAFCRLGSSVTIVQDEAKLAREERDAAQILAQAMARDGVNILLNTRVIRARLDAAERSPGHAELQDKERRFRGLRAGKRWPDTEYEIVAAGGCGYPLAIRQRHQDRRFPADQQPTRLRCREMYACRTNILMSRKVLRESPRTMRWAAQRTALGSNNSVVHILRARDCPRGASGVGGAPAIHPYKDLHRNDARYRSRDYGLPG